MIASQPDVRITNEERYYLVLRSAVILTGVLFYLLGYIPAARPSQRMLMVWSLALAGVPTVLIYAAVVRGFRPVSRLMLWVAPADFIAFTIFASLSGPLDPMFPIGIIFAVVFAMALKRRQANLLSIGIAASYFYGHILASDVPLTIAIVGFEATLIVVISALVAGTVRRMRLRECDAEEAILERETINATLERRVSGLQAVSDISEVMHSSLDFDEVGPLVLDIVTRVVKLDSLCIFVLDEDKNETIFSASVGSQLDRAVPGPGPELADVEGHFTCLRMFNRGSLAVIFCAPGDEIDGLTEDDRLVIHTVASELAVAVENSRLYKLTRRLAITDELTGMYNYRYFRERLDEEVSRARRYSKPVSLLMLDTDDFKSFNDRHGHLAGDRTLAEFAGVLNGLVRQVDLLARYGGEEFAIILPETDVAGAYTVAEKIRESVAQHPFRDGDGVSCCTLTVSIGVATYPDHAHDRESLLREADNALYRAKGSGRDRVCTPARMHGTDTTPRRDT